ELEKAAPDHLDALVDAGLLLERNGSYWPAERLYSDAWPESLPEIDRKIARGLAKYYAVTPKRYNSLLQKTKDQAAAQLEQLATAAGAPLREVAMPRSPDATSQPVAGEDGTSATYILSPGARGRIYQELYPRQILTIWGMHEENIRRHESREVFATDRRTPNAYSDEYGLADPKRAEAELDELVTAGFLEDGTLVPINYWVVLKEENFLLYFLTSAIITVAVVGLTLMMSSMLGYSLARVRFPGKFAVFTVMIAAAVLPGEARIIPIFKMLLSIDALDGLWGLVFWLASFGVGNALLMAGFFWTLPKEVDEAASVDGAGPFRQFFDIALPMARPIVMTVGIFAFLTAWNNFLIPLICTISRPNMQPLAVAVYNFQQGHAGKWHQINAAAAIMIIPVILLFLIVQKHVVKSIAVGAVKG
ncbi:MAG: carbohydrate ABC transporter permease, partial [Planctomycetota bacterium]